jgi:hypothetical protein
MDFKRLLTHLLTPGWRVRRAFGAADLAAIGAEVAASEQTHRGELRFVIEGPLPFALLWRGVSARERATELFSRLGVWDTEANSGILIYVQLVDRRVEILADRGIARRVPQEAWDAICRRMEEAFRLKAYRRGALEAIDEASRLLALHFPARGNNPDELPNQPLVLL